MKTIIDTVHHHKIGQRPDGRWGTYVADPTKPNGRKEVRKATLSELYEYLISFYGIGTQVTKNILFSELFAEWVEYKKKTFIGVRNTQKGLSPSTINRYQTDYDNYIKGSPFEGKAIRSITTTNLEIFLAEIIRIYDMTESCAQNIIGYFNQMFAYALRTEHIISNPMLLVDKDKLLANCLPSPKKSGEDLVLTTDEFRRLLEVLRNHEKKYPEYMPDYAIELACLTGMRRGELAALKWSCIDDFYIHIDFSEHRLDYKDKPSEIIVGEPKNRKHRKIPLTRDIKNLLERIKAVSVPNDEGFVFVDRQGSRYTASKIGNAATRRFKAIGIKKGSIHKIRRTVSSLLQKVMSKADVSSLLGHSEKVNEMSYTGPTATLQEKMRVLNLLSDTLYAKEIA